MWGLNGERALGSSPSELYLWGWLSRAFKVSFAIRLTRVDSPHVGVSRLEAQDSRLSWVVQMMFGLLYLHIFDMSSSFITLAIAHESLVGLSVGTLANTMVQSMHTKLSTSQSSSI